jgi:hypothetical protein
VKIRIAVGLGPADLDADQFAALVADLAELRFDSLWISEILTGPGPDPLLALATAAQLNPKLKLGTTMLLPGRNEVRLAKALATLDVLSRGRLLITFVPGLAYGAERRSRSCADGGRGRRSTGSRSHRARCRSRWSCGSAAWLKPPWSDAAGSARAGSAPPARPKKRVRPSRRSTPLPFKPGGKSIPSTSA